LPPAKSSVTDLIIEPTFGYVNDTVNVQANTTQENGTYTILFDTTPLTSGTATGTTINTNITIPNTTSGLHNVTIRDQTGETNTTVTVLTKYSLSTSHPPTPQQLQQNDTTTIFLNVTGGEANPVHWANLTITTPNTDTYWMNITLTNTTETGVHKTNVTYPSAGWTPTTPNTNYTGTYTVNWLNETQSQATTTFSIGITNQTQYHRRDTADIRAVDYQPDQNVTITIQNSTITQTSSFSTTFNATADTNGVIHATWNVSSNTPIAIYNITITPTPPSKANATDTQTFTVPGFLVNVFTRNLANQTVPSIFVRAHDQQSNAFYNASSNATGVASFMLERGNQIYEAIYKLVKVGDASDVITGEKSLNFTCQLTTLNTTILDAQNPTTTIPFVTVTITYNYTTNFEVTQNRTDRETGTTTISGTLQFTSLLPNITYIVNASRYGEIFNQDNNTIPNLPTTPYYDTTILLPSRTLQLTVVDGINQPIPNATVQAQEATGGLTFTQTTDPTGTATLTGSFGRYSIFVYTNNILLNQTTIDLFQNQNETMTCNLYNLDISVSVTDYFGQPIANAKVTWQGNGLRNSGTTASDGKVTFNNIIGGNLRFTVSLPGQSQTNVVATSYVDSSTTIQIRIGEYVNLLGFLVETSQLAIVIIIVVAVVLILALEIYRRRRHKKSKETPS
jgi:hypothetical protein